MDTTSLQSLLRFSHPDLLQKLAQHHILHGNFQNISHNSIFCGFTLVFLFVSRSSIIIVHELFKLSHDDMLQKNILEVVILTIIIIVIVIRMLTYR
jgi:hypothetical protein